MVLLAIAGAGATAAASGKSSSSTIKPLEKNTEILTKTTSIKFDSIKSTLGRAEQSDAAKASYVRLKLAMSVKNSEKIATDLTMALFEIDGKRVAEKYQLQDKAVAEAFTKKVVEVLSNPLYKK